MISTGFNAAVTARLEAIDERFWLSHASHPLWRKLTVPLYHVSGVL